MRISSVIVILAWLLSVCSCGNGSKMDAQWEEIDRLCDTLPKMAISNLDTIDQSGLSKKDLNRFRLLCIKSRDKAYIAHTSDTLILDVIDYYARHRSEGLYPEALYYGGRVYSDIGDAPTALRYFQEAMDALPEGNDDNLRSRIYSQMGSLLNSLRLYKEASELLNKTIKIKTADGDSLNLMRDIQLLGAVYMHADDYDKADSCFRKAREIAVAISHRDTVIQDMYMAGIELCRGNISEALNGIRSVARKMLDKKRDIVYAYASQIYLDAGIPDTAFLFACKLLGSTNNDYRKNGYKLLLDPALREYSSTDSLISYTLAYEKVLDEYFAKHDAGQVTIQTSLYNYQIHERERRKAEESGKKYMYAAGVALILVLILCIGLLYLRNKKMKLRLHYHNALDNIDQLEKSLSSKNVELTELRKTVEGMKLENEEKKHMSDDERSDIKNKDNRFSRKETEEDQLRKQLKERLLSLQRAGEARRNKPDEILSSSVHTRLQKNISAEIPVEENDDVWMEIEDAVSAASPEFKSRLTLLAGGRMKPDVYRMALLVRCGFGPTEIGILLGRTKGAVSSRRSYICEKIFGEKMGAKVMDDIINLL